MSDFSKRIANLSPARLELLTRRLAEREQSLPQTETVTRGKETDGPPPLSFAQERIWFLQQLEPSSPAFNIPLAVRIRGRLDADAFGRSLDEVVRRQGALRTTFASTDGTLVQLIAARPSADMRRLDLRTLSPSEREAKISAHTAEEARRPFDLSAGPLMRASLVRLDESEHVLLLTLHHIISDGWSMGVLVREVAALYAALSEGRPPTLPELPVQYADYARWQRDWMSGPVLDAHLRYWRDRLKGPLPVLELPADRPRPLVQSYRGSVRSFTLPASLSSALKELSRREGATLFMTLLAAFQVLLQRYTNQDEIIVGTNIANRNRPEVENLIGLFVNNLVLRGDLSGNPTFRELLARVRGLTLGAYAHQDLPFELLLEELRPDRAGGQSPLFQVMFVLQNNPLPQLRLPGLTFSPIKFSDETTKFDLTLFMLETAEGLGGAFEYNTELFRDSTVGRLSEQFETLLTDVTADPDRDLMSLAVGREEQSRQLISAFNQTLE